MLTSSTVDLGQCPTSREDKHFDALVSARARSHDGRGVPS